jgi:hypothetical protein
MKERAAHLFNSVDGKLLNGKTAHQDFAHILMQLLVSGVEGVSLVLYGDSGDGKTQSATNIHLKVGDVVNKVPSVVFVGSLMRMHNLSGIPYQQNGLTKQTMMEWFDRIIKNSYKCAANYQPAGFIILDEFNQVDDEVLSASHEMLAERSLNGRKLPKGWIVIGMANPPGVSGFNVAPFTRPVINRMAHVLFMPSPESAINYFENGKQPIVVDMEDLNKKPSHPKMHPHLLKYLEDNPTHLQTTHPIKLEDTNKPLPTSRGWEALDKILKAFDVLPGDNSAVELTEKKLEEVENWARATVGGSDAGYDQKPLAKNIKEVIRNYTSVQWDELVKEHLEAHRDSRPSKVPSIVQDLEANKLGIMLDSMVTELCKEALGPEGLELLSVVFDNMALEQVSNAWSQLRAAETLNSNEAIFEKVGTIVAKAIANGVEV